MPAQTPAYYTTPDENFNKAYGLLLENHSYNDLIKMLEIGNIPQRQLAALLLEEVKSVKDADILARNLTGQDGKIREATSLKVNEFMSNQTLCAYFQTERNYKIFLDAIIDINGNVCRNIISAICRLKSNENFCTFFCPQLVAHTLDILDKIKDFDFQEGKYKVNKEVFKLYWYLETVYEFSDFIDFSDLKEIIILAASIDEYTIREKAAKILTKGFEDEALDKIKLALKSDKNYYVRRY